MSRRSTAASRAPRRRPASTRPRGISGQAAMPSAAGRDRLPDVDVRVADDQHVRRAGDATCSAIRVSLLPGTRWSTSTPSRRAGLGPKLARRRVGQVVDAVEVLHHDALDRAGRRPRSSRPARRRACPRRRSGWRARPGRVPRRRRPSPTRSGAGAAGRTAGARTSVTGSPSSRKPAGRAGRTGVLAVPVLQRDRRAGRASSRSRPPRRRSRSRRPRPPGRARPPPRDRPAPRRVGVPRQDVVAGSGRRRRRTAG